MLLRKYPDKETFKQSASQADVIGLCAEVLADVDTPVSLLSRLYDDKGQIFLLESVEGSDRWARYSFLGISAHATVRIYNDRVEIEKNGQIESVEHKGDPLAVLRDIIGPIKCASVGENIRFDGGLVGYLSYEAVSFFEKKVPNKLDADTPIGCFMIPNELLVFDNVNHSLTVIALAFKEDCDDLDKLYNDTAERLEQMLHYLENSTQREVEHTNPDLVLKPVIPEQEYRDRVNTVREMIYDGEIIQAVISQPFQCDAPDDPVALYRVQRYINPSPYMFFMHLDDMIIVGSSPETMVSLENDVATVRPIAGTRPRGKTEQEDRALADELLADEKERAEHIMLVDLGRNDLGKVSRAGTVQVTDLMFVERYSHVMHLVSNVIGEMEDEYDAFDLIKAAFPAGTLSGAPKVRAMEIIADLEKTPRGPYGGAVGYISFDGNMDMAITIRTATIQNNKLTVRAGAGIVADSIDENERVETVNKARSIQRTLEIMTKAGGAL